MNDRDAAMFVKGLLDGFSDVEVAAVCTQAISEWRHHADTWEPDKSDPVREATFDTFSVHGDLGRRLIPILATRRGVTKFDADRQKEVFIDDDALTQVWMRSFVEYVWWMERSGLVAVLQKGPGGYPINLRMTKRGAAFFRASQDHPLLPGFLERIATRCPNLPVGVVTLIADARSCLDAMLLRPAVILMGVAYELAIEHVVDELVTKGLLNQNTPAQLPAERIKRIKAALTLQTINAVLPSVDDRTAAIAAYDFADSLRLQRNQAAHTTPALDFTARSETEEFLVSASRHLPAIWSLTR